MHHYNKISMKKLIIILGLFTFLHSNAQLTWDSTYYDHSANSIIQTYNNEYIVAGAVFKSMSFRWNISKLDSSGKIIKDTIFIQNSDHKLHINATPDSGYIVLGMDTSTMIFRYDKNDQLLWKKYLPGASQDIINSNDNGHIIIGNCYVANMHSDLLKSIYASKQLLEKDENKLKEAIGEFKRTL